MPHSPVVPFADAAFLESPLVRMAVRGPRSLGANDNDGRAPPFRQDSDIAIVAALHALAEHGLRAAREMYDRAEAALLTGRRADFDWWFGICRTLDARLAADLVRRFECNAPN